MMNYLLDFSKPGKRIWRNAPTEKINVLFDPRLVRALWKDTVTTLNSPS